MSKMSMKMNFNSIFLIVLLQSVYFGDCDVENKYAREGENTYIDCIFYVGKANESFQIIWSYPDFAADQSRIDYETATIQNQSIYSILTIKNVTRAKDKGKYDCILNQFTIDNETIYLTEKNYNLNIINSIDKFANAADEVDGPITTFINDESKIKLKFPIEPPIEPKVFSSSFESNKGEHQNTKSITSNLNTTKRPEYVTAFPMDKSVDEKIDKLVKIFGSIIFIILIIIIISCICCCIRKRRPKTNVTV